MAIFKEDRVWWTNCYTATAVMAKLFINCNFDKLNGSALYIPVRRCNLYSLIRAAFSEIEHGLYPILRKLA